MSWWTMSVFFLQLTKHLPPRCVGYPWTLVYSSDRNGFSLQSLYRSMTSVDSPVLLAIKDTNNQVSESECNLFIWSPNSLFPTSGLFY